MIIRDILGAEGDLLEAEEELLAELALGDEGVEVRGAEEPAGALDLLAPRQVEGVVDGADLVARRVRVAAHAAAVGALQHLHLVGGEVEVQLAQEVGEALVRVHGTRAALVRPHPREAQRPQPREAGAGGGGRARGAPRLPLGGRRWRGTWRRGDTRSDENTMRVTARKSWALSDCAIGWVEGGMCGVHTRCNVGCYCHRLR